MPIAVVAEFDAQSGDRSTHNYDAMCERLNAEGDPPAGLILHTAGFDAGRERNPRPTPIVFPNAWA